MSEFIIAPFAMMGAIAIFLAILLHHFYRLYSRKYLRYWSLSWFAFALYTLGGIYTIFTYGVIGVTHPLRLFSAVATLAASYLHLTWLFLGTYAAATKRAVPAGGVRWGVIGSLALAAALTLAFAFDPDATEARFFLRVGLRDLLAGIVFLGGGIALTFYWKKPGNLGQLLVVLSFWAYGLSNAVQFLHPLLNLFERRLPDIYLSYLNYLDFLALIILGMGLILWMLEEERRNVVTTRATLQESEEQLHLALEAARMGTWAWNIMTSKVTWSPDVEQLFGLAPGTFAGTYEAYRALVYPEDLPLLDEKLREALEEGKDYTIEHRFTRPDGSLRWLEARGQVYHNGKGTPVRMRGTVTDVTDRKQAEAALRESEERFRRLSEASFEGIVLSDQGKIIDHNAQLASMLGYEPHDMIGMDVMLFVAPESRELVLEKIKAGDEGPYEHLVRHPDGSTFPVEVQAKTLPYAGRQIRVTAIRDISERKQAEMALRASEAKFSKAFRASPDAIVITSLSDGEILDVNESFLRRSGYSRDEVVGRTTLELNTWADPEDRDRIMETLHTEGRVRDFECALRTKTGDIRICLDSAEIIELEGKRRLLSVLRDVTEQKKAEKEREKLIAELEARNAELERFTYTVSHDLKTPLVTIKGFLGLLQKDVATGNTERIRQDIAQIASAADKMAQLLGELLELSRIGRLMNPPEEVSLTDLAGEAVALVDGLIRQRNVTIEVDPEMPMVFGDRLRLLEVYQNLVENAVKFMGDQPAPRIEIGAREREGQVVCFVKDNGMGIEPRYHEKVFGLFNRLEADVEGTGIGLALVRRIVEVHGGRLWVESEGKKKGSIFCFSLPMPS